MNLSLFRRKQFKPGVNTTLDESGETNVLDLFHESATQVPAYKKFLEEAGVDHKQIVTYDDFVKHVPIIDKDNYLRKYPLNELCKDGDLFTNRIISVSSGSSGMPFYWPRGIEQDVQGTLMHTDIYDHIFSMDQKKTLLVICFSMGTWIAGSFTVASSFGYADNGRPLNIVTPGLEKTEAINAVKNLSGYYDQVVLAGYPPFIKDIIEEGSHSGIDWGSTKTRLLMAGEAFSEEWRDYVLNLLHSDDPYHDAINIYGSADAGMLGNETPLSILVRRVYDKHPELLERVFGTNILPSIVQFHPEYKKFELVNNQLAFTSNAGTPLIRYNIKDTGGVRSFEELIEPVRDEIEHEAQQLGIDLSQWNRPFVFLNGRKDFSVTIYAVNIYPENIKSALIDPRLRGFVTGKFTMATQNYSDMDQYFEVNVELAKDHGVSPDFEVLVRKVVVEKLLELNAEFHKLNAAIGDKSLPRIRLIEFGNEDYFAVGVKHRWVKKG